MADLTIKPQAGSGNKLIIQDQAGNARVTTGDAGIDIPAVSGNLTVAGTIIPSSPLSHRNVIINGDFRIAQAMQSGTAEGYGVVNNPLHPDLNSHRGFNNDDAYGIDRWLLLSDGNNIVDVHHTTGQTTNSKCIGLDVETTNKKFGIVQIMENQNCDHLIGNEVTLSFYAKVSATTNLDNVKCAIMSWQGTVDTVTSDFVNAWSVEGTDPTLISNWAYENTPANLNVTTSWVRYSITCTPDTSNTKNLAVFIWSDVTTTSAGEFLYISDVQLELGGTATPFERRSTSQQLADCMRYMQFPVYPNCNGLSAPPGTIVSHNGSSCFGIYIFPVPMRVIPSVGINQTTNWWHLTGDSQGLVASSMVMQAQTKYMAKVQVTCSGSDQGFGYITTANHASAMIEFMAEM